MAPHIPNPNANIDANPVYGMLITLRANSKNLSPQLRSMTHEDMRCFNISDPGSLIWTSEPSSASSRARPKE